MNAAQTSIEVELSNGSLLSIPNTVENRHYRKIVEWVAQGNTILPYIPPAEPSQDELYDLLMQNNKLIKALALALNDGSFVPNSSYTNAQLKSIIKQKL